MRTNNMKKLTTLLLCIAATLLIHSAQAIDRLCINADNTINHLYVDGQELTSRLPNRGNLKKCDCVEIPSNTGVIAVEATNIKGVAGIQTCETPHAALYQDWRCRPSTRAKTSDWYTAGYNDAGWKPAHGYPCVKHCHKYYKMPCPMAASKCYWANKKNSKTVRCRVKQCADDCTGCSNSGAGSCDVGKCRLGDAGLNTMGRRICNRRCDVEVKAWGQQNEAANGYIKVTDKLTNYVETYSANVPGDYLATIDMSSCKITNRMYGAWFHNDAVLGSIQTWNNAGMSPSFVNVIGIELAVGPSDPPTDVANGVFGSYAPMYNVWQFGVGLSSATYNGRHGFSATFTGVQNGGAAVSITNVVQTD